MNWNNAFLQADFIQLHLLDYTMFVILKPNTTIFNAIYHFKIVKVTRRSSENHHESLCRVQVAMIGNWTLNHSVHYRKVNMIFDVITTNVLSGLKFGFDVITTNVLSRLRFGLVLRYGS
jgi:hypothetical protein